jgi:hypothetical protein
MEKEYIYLCDRAWKSGSLKVYDIPKNSIVFDIDEKNGIYHFTLKETGEKYETNYKDLLIENTKKNLNILKRIKKKKEKIKKIEERIVTLKNNIKRYED